jgi:hypothetical protein
MIAYISKAEFQDLDSRYQSIGGMLVRMIDRAHDFCKDAAFISARSRPTRRT